MDDAAYREFAKDGIVQFSRRPIERGSVAHFGRDDFSSSTCRIDDGLAPLGGATRRSSSHEKTRSNERIYYLADAVDALRCRRRRRSTGRGLSAKTTGMVPHRRGKADRPRSGERRADQRPPIATVFDESRSYRIDHTSGKRPSRNILVMRFANSISSRLSTTGTWTTWQITVAEEEGVGTRAGYYDQAGACGTDPETTCSSCSR